MSFNEQADEAKVGPVEPGYMSVTVEFGDDHTGIEYYGNMISQFHQNKESYPTILSVESANPADYRAVGIMKITSKLSVKNKNAFKADVDSLLKDAAPPEPEKDSYRQGSAVDEEEVRSGKKALIQKTDGDSLVGKGKETSDGDSDCYDGEKDAPSPKDSVLDEGDEPDGVSESVEEGDPVEIRRGQFKGLKGKVEKVAEDQVIIQLTEPFEGMWYGVPTEASAGTRFMFPTTSVRKGSEPEAARAVGEETSEIDVALKALGEISGDTGGTSMAYFTKDEPELKSSVGSKKTSSAKDKAKEKEKDKDELDKALSDLDEAIGND